MKTFSEKELADFLTKHRDEWWTPNEIAKENKVDIRTIKTMIKRLSYSLGETYTSVESSNDYHRRWIYAHSLSSTAYRGFRIETVERRRIYAVRMVKDIPWSTAKVDEKISGIQKSISVLQSVETEKFEEIVSQKDFYCKELEKFMSASYRNSFSKHLDQAAAEGDSKAIEELKEKAEWIKKYRIESLNKELAELHEIKEKLDQHGEY
jgi:hypothetical protein